MKKFFLPVCLIMFISVSAFSQTINNIPLKELKAEYIRVSEDAIVMSRKINIYLDYGQPFKIKNLRVMDEDGSPMQFNSMIHVLNYMSTLGYKLVQGGDSTTSFLLRKMPVDEGMHVE